MKVETNTLLTVITVCRNNLEGLKKTCASVLVQDYEDFEWLIVDGASTDGTVEFLREIKCDRLRWVSEPDHGIYDAMNKAVKQAAGKRVLFLNSGDSFAAPDALSRLLDKPSDADVVYGDVNLVWPNRTILFPGLDNPSVEALMTTSLPHPASAILLETLLKYGGYDTKYKIVSDWKFWLELARDNASFEHRSVLVADFAKDGVSTSQAELCSFEREKVKRELFGMIKLSVVIPVYNVEPFIGECLDSILSQQVELEVICVDDNSTDKSAAICEEYAQKHPNITVVRNTTNQFAGTCRNTGIDLAKGEYIAFMDSDDRTEPGIYRKLVDIADKEKLDVVRGAARIFDAQTGEFIDDQYWRQDRFKGPAREGKVVDYKDVIEDLVGVACVPFTGICRRDLLINNNIRYNSLRCSNDISFFIEMMLKASRVKFVPDSVAQYRVNNSKSLVGVRTKYYGDVLTCGREIVGRIKDYDAEIRKKVLNYVFNAYPHWLETAVSQSEPTRQEEIREAYRKFFRDLDKRPWGGRMHDKWWVEALEEYLGKEPFVEPEPYLVSVIIPVFNAAEYVEACLDSLAKAAAEIGCENVEVICIDDGSRDDSLKILKDYEARNRSSFGKMVVIHQENAGQGSARNKGVRLATGSYLYYLDADDLVRNDIFSSTIPRMQKDKLEILLFSAEPFADIPGLEKRIEGHQLYYSICETALNKVVSGCRLVELSKEKWSIHVSPPLRIYDRAFVLRNKLFFPEGMFHEDYAVGYLALFAANRVLAIPDKLYFRRETLSSTTGDPANEEKCIRGHKKNAQILSEYAASHAWLAEINLIPLCELANVILANPEMVPYGKFFKCIVQQIKRTLVTNKSKENAKHSHDTALERELANCRAQLKRKREELDSLANSSAYRFGMAITWPARKLWRAFRDNPIVDAWLKRRK